MIEVSVIIPVYNAGKFVSDAVKSALSQPETKEVILIEDGSPDDSLKRCIELTKKDARVRLLRHPFGKNRGASASRNVGLRHAVCDYIAFLDADDYYLQNRFKTAEKVFHEHSDCLGVYEAIGTVFEDNRGIERWESSSEMKELIITMREVIQPEELFTKLVNGGSGYFSLDGVVLKRELINQSGFMNSSLNMHEDNEFMFRLAYSKKLYPGSLQVPVSVRRVHVENRITAPRTEKEKFESRLKMWIASYRWFNKKGFLDGKGLVSKRLFDHFDNFQISQKYGPGYIAQVRKRIALLKLFLKAPCICTEKMFWQRLLPVRLRQR